MIACQNGNYEMVELLLEKGAKILRSDAYRRSALIHSIISGNVKITSLLLKRGSLFNKGDRSDNSPLHYASAFGFY